LGIHRVVDTSGFAATATVLEVAGHTDLFLYDLKHMNDNIHRRYTGVSNQLILHNLLELSTAGAAIRVRIPLIAGLNDDPENIQATADFIADCPGIQGVDLLPYHSSAKAKYRKLCRDFPAQETTAPARERLDAAMAILRRTREDITIGG
jgi:pyruvate formate lyase activating enzyme